MYEVNATNAEIKRLLVDAIKDVAAGKVDGILILCLKDKKEDVTYRYFFGECSRFEWLGAIEVSKNLLLKDGGDEDGEVTTPAPLPGLHS